MLVLADEYSSSQRLHTVAHAPVHPVNVSTRSVLPCVDQAWLTEWPERANLSIAEVPSKVCEFIRSRLRCHPEVGVGFYFGVHEVNCLRGKHAIECAEGSVDGTYDKRSGVMGGKLQGRCMVDLVAVFVFAV